MGKGAPNDKGASAMSKADSDATAPKRGTKSDAAGIVDTGWNFDDGGDFVSEHTTVDPTLLERLAALDGKDDDDEAIDLNSQEISSLVQAEDDDEEVLGITEDDLIEDDDLVEDDDEADKTLAIEVPPEKVDAGASKVPEPTIQLDESLASYDFADEKTQVFVTAIEDEPTRAKLKVIQGGGQQKEFLIARDRITMGRGTNNDVLIPDIAISRQHCAILRISNGKFKLKDMSSGNGTKLNGSRVLEADLLAGDRIEVGGTILEFSLTGAGAQATNSERHIVPHPSEVASPSPATSPGPATSHPAKPAKPPAPIDYSQGHGATMTAYQLPAEPEPAGGTNTLITLLIAAFGLLFVLLAAIIVGKLVLDYRAQGQGDTKVAAKPASDYYFEGIDSAKEREWDDAESKFKVAMDLARDEGAFQVRKDAQAQIEMVQKERGFKKAFERGQALADSGDQEEALSTLDSIRSGSAYYKEARKRVIEIRKDYAKALIIEADKDFAAKKYADVDAKVSKALRAAPGYAPAEALRRKLADIPPEEYKPEPKPVVVARGEPWKAKPTAVKRPAANAGQNKPKAPAVKSSKGGADFAKGVALFKNRQFGEAATFFDGIAASDETIVGKKAANLAKTVRRFQTSFTQGTAAYKARDYPKASRLLTNAARSDNVVAGGGGAFRAEIRDMLAESHYQQARAAFNGQNYGLAGSNAKRALGYKPSHAGNQALIGQLEGKAKGMYVEAVNKKGADPKQAKRIAKNIMAMLPASSDTYRKAKTLFSEL